MASAESLVIDLGSAIVKAGYQEGDAPQAVFPTLIGRPKSHTRATGYLYGQKDRYIGDEANSRRSTVNLSYPIQKGEMKNVDDVEAILHHMFYNELRVAPEEQDGVLFTETAGASAAYREKLTQMLFEAFSVTGVFIKPAPFFGLYGTGLQSGMVIDIGESTQIYPVHEGKAVNEAIVTRSVGGGDVTNYMQQLLTERGYYLSSSADWEVVRDIKEKLGYVALDYDQELQNHTMSSEGEKSYELPSCNVITISSERCRAPEILFRPDLFLYDEQESLVQSITKSINALTPEQRPEVLSNIHLAGGCTMLEGFKERLEKELQAAGVLLPETKIHAVPERKYLNWIGAGLFSRTPTFANLKVDKNEYDEVGPSIIHRCNEV